MTTKSRILNVRLTDRERSQLGELVDYYTAEEVKHYGESARPWTIADTVRLLIGAEHRRLLGEDRGDPQ